METAEKRGRIEVEDEADEIPSLPQEMIVDILSRLPVKSLCKFRCVSKLWLSLVSDPVFVDTHFGRTLENAGGLYSQRQRVLISSGKKLYSVNYESIHEDSDDIVAQELECPSSPSDRASIWIEKAYTDFWMPARPIHRVDLLGSFYGLVCIDVDEGDRFLFNPATRESKKIPEPPLDDVHSLTNMGRGFGYNHVNDDYKLVEVWCGISWVYSLRSDEWKRVEDFGGDFQHETGVLLNDATHWVVSYGSYGFGFGPYSKLSVAGFDLTRETFWEWDMPAIDAIDRTTEFSAGVYEGCLCLLYSGKEMEDHFWLMTEYGEKDSWTKFTVSFSYGWMRPLCTSVNGESLLVVDGKLVLYNSEDNSDVELYIDCFPGRFICEADTYVESLISSLAYCRSQDDVQDEAQM